MSLLKRHYCGNAQVATLASPLSAGALSASVTFAGGAWNDLISSSLMGTGGAAWSAVLDYGTATEEKIRCGGSPIVPGTPATIPILARGIDGTTAQSHSATTGTILPCFTVEELEEIQSAIQLQSLVIGSLAQGQIVQGNASGQFATLTPGAAGTLLTSAGPGSPLVYGTPALLVDSGWITVSSFSNGWGAGGIAPAYRKIGNRVQLRGQFSAGTAATTAFVLPSGFHPTPSSSRYITGYSTTSVDVVLIDSLGNVQPQASATTWLDGITFLVD